MHSTLPLKRKILILSVLLAGCFFNTARGQDINRAIQEGLFTISNKVDKKTVLDMLQDAALLSKKEPDSAMVLFQRALRLGIENNYPEEVADAYSHIATIYNNKGKYEEAYAEGKKMLAIAFSLKMEKVMPAVYNSFANRFQRKGMYDSAMYYYYAAINLVENDTSKRNAALPTLYTNLSGILETIGDYEKGLLYLNKAEVLARDMQHWHLLSLILINKGNAFNNLKNLDSSNYNLKEALAIARKHHFLQWQHLALSNLGSTNYQQGRYKEALSYLEEALLLKGDIDPNYQNTNVALMGKLYLSMGNYKLAEQYLQRSLHTAEQLNIARDLTEGHRVLSELYAQTGNFRKAYDHQFTYTQIKDSIEGISSKQNINQLEVKYRTAQKDKELVEKKLQISRQGAQIKQKNIWIIGISSGALLLAAIAALLYSLYRSSWHQKRFQEEKFRTLEQEQEIGQLRAMMKGEEKERIRIAQDLHDGIGGMLASIKMNLNAIKEDKQELQSMPGFQKVTDMLSDTATEVRKTAHNLMPDALARQSLREALLQYCENNSSSILQIDLQFDVQESFHKASELFLYRIIQELVQNITKHAKATHAVIQLMLHENNLSIIVEDNGSGFDSSLSHKGAGLLNIHKRVEALQGYISLSSRKDKGTTVHIEFDFTKLNNI
jgi:signal transduction histidine kinase/predicted small secreted protein